MTRFLTMITVIAARIPLDKRALKLFQRPPSAQRRGTEPAVPPIAACAAALDRLCARTNDGLAAVALALALLLAATAMVRHPDVFLPARDAESGLAAGDALTSISALQAP